MRKPKGGKNCVLLDRSTWECRKKRGKMSSSRHIGWRQISTGRRRRTGLMWARLITCRSWAFWRISWQIRKRIIRRTSKIRAWRHPNKRKKCRNLVRWVYMPTIAWPRSRRRRNQLTVNAPRQLQWLKKWLSRPPWTCPTTNSQGQGPKRA